jgi:hypothetical protein
MRLLGPQRARELSFASKGQHYMRSKDGHYAQSRNKGGRPRIDPELRKLIINMWQPNPTWGKPRIQAELAKLGIIVSDSTVLRYRPKTNKPPSQTWKRA